jgi:hypothetical protein
MPFLVNVLISACLISFAAWLSRRYPVTAGFIVALPLTSMLVLPLAHLQHADTDNSVLMARSILIAIPVSLTFFLPFLFAGRLGLSFWAAYALGCAALPVGFFVHRAVVRLL